MNYTDQLAEQVSEQYGLGRTARYRWEAAGKIPDIYFTDGFVKPKPFTESQKKQQEAFIAIITQPIILHSAFADNVSFGGKLDEMISLRKGKKEKRVRKGRPQLPLLNFSQGELVKVANQMRGLADVVETALAAANKQPYERRQETLKELLRSRPELTVRQTVASLDKASAWRWINFVAGVRSLLPPTDKAIIAHVVSELQDLLAMIQESISPQRVYCQPCQRMVKMN